MREMRKMRSYCFLWWMLKQQDISRSGTSVLCSWAGLRYCRLRPFNVAEVAGICLFKTWKSVSNKYKGWKDKATVDRQHFRISGIDYVLTHEDRWGEASQSVDDFIGTVRICFCPIVPCSWGREPLRKRPEAINRGLSGQRSAGQSWVAAIAPATITRLSPQWWAIL